VVSEVVALQLEIVNLVQRA